MTALPKSLPELPPLTTITSPSPHRAITELASVLELPRLLLAAPRLAKQPKGQGQPVLVFPGYGTNDTATALLRAYLRYLGYTPYGWGLGHNHGGLGKLLPKCRERLAALAEQHGQPVHVIGWSLGGIIARESARSQQDKVASLITLGTPVIGGPKYTAFAAGYRRRGYNLDQLELDAAARELNPLTMPVTSVFSRNDAVVAWQASVDRVSQNVEHVEVGCKHFGMGYSPEVFAVVAERLGRLR